MAVLFVCRCPYAASAPAHERALHTVGPDLVLEAVHRDLHDLHDIAGFTFRHEATASNRGTAAEHCTRSKRRHLE